jgi:hypothetical protein
MTDIKKEFDELKQYIESKLTSNSGVNSGNGSSVEGKSVYNPVSGKSIILLLVAMLGFPFLVYHFF